ncbi:MAG: reverse transcriptase family protein, partial [Mesoflavibacter sp.]|nr:reverse transcriptase family protein [Mesoflavibacter sp.]
SSGYFHILNAEKASKAYSSLLKNSKKGDSISQIKNDLGESFASEHERNVFLSNHFEKKFGTPFLSNKSLVDFLGNNINHPKILEHKLNNIDRDNLEADISINELKESLNSANLNSSVGPDGIPFRMLVKFWDILSLPLLKGFKEMINKKQLRGMLRYGKIRLIAKKNSDLSKIKSWRSIFCLSTVYKIFSGVIDNRLKKVIDKINIRSQKAYSSTYTIQENLIHTYELISKTLASNSSLAIALIDFQAAFDCIGHEYLKDVLTFMNFGPNMIDMILTCMNDRFAHILTDTGITPNFPMKVSVMQGDRPSPNLFKIAITPLLLIISINSDIEIPRALPFKLNDTDTQPDSESAFADDCQISFVPTAIALKTTFQILTSFAEVSNLKTNINKTKICIIGRQATNEFLLEVNILGLEIVDEFTILGIHFDSKLSKMQDNWTTIVKKMSKIRNFWALFYLTTPGKIAIIKGFILPLLNYVGVVIFPSEDIVMQIENIIISFLCQSRPIAKAKIFSSIENGGLGIPKVVDFLRSLDILIYKKSLSIVDTWSLELKNTRCQPNDPFYFYENLDKRNSPILFRIIESFQFFSNSFWLNHNNIKDMRIFKNKLFCNSEKQMLTRAIFTETTWLRYENEIKSICFGDVLNTENVCLDYRNFKLKSNANFNYMEYLRLRGFVQHNITIYSNKLSKPQTKISSILLKPNVKSKHFRQFLTIDDQKLEKCKSYLKRYNWAELEELDLERERNWQKVWTFCFLPINIREFSFRSVNNYNYFNANISYFRQESPECTLCRLDKYLPAPRETAKHFYIDCPVTTNITTNYFTNFLQHTEQNFDKSWMLLGVPKTLNKKFTLILNIEIILVTFFLFQSRLKKKIPLISNLYDFINFQRKFLIKNKNYKIGYEKSILQFDPG